MPPPTCSCNGNAARRTKISSVHVGRRAFFWSPDVALEVRDALGRGSKGHGEDLKEGSLFGGNFRLTENLMLMLMFCGDFLGGAFLHMFVPCPHEKP